MHIINNPFVLWLRHCLCTLLHNEDLTPEELLLLREFSTRYAPVLASLSIEERMLLEAKLEKRNYAELAVAWGITKEAVKTRVFRLMERLREALREEESTETPFENSP